MRLTERKVYLDILQRKHRQAQVKMLALTLILDIPNTSNLVVVTFDQKHDEDKINSIFSPFGSFAIHPLNDAAVILEFQDMDESFARVFDSFNDSESLTVQTYESFTAQTYSPPSKKRRS